MSSPPPLPRSGDLRLLLALVPVGVGVTLLFDGPLTSGIAATLIVGAPGYAIVAALFAGVRLPGEERAALTVVFGVAAIALIGTAVQVVLPLGAATWSVLLVLLTAVACAIAEARRGERRRERMRRRSRSVPIRAVLFAIAATALFAAAIEIAAQGVHDQQRRQRFASVWMVPGGSHGVTVRIGVSNHGLQGPPFRLVLRRGSTVLRAWSLRLTAGERWQRRIRVDRAGALRLELARRDGTPYRSVELRASARS